MLIYVNITDRQTDGQTDKHIKSIVRNLSKHKESFICEHFRPGLKNAHRLVHLVLAHGLLERHNLATAGQEDLARVLIEGREYFAVVEGHLQVDDDLIGHGIDHLAALIDFDRVQRLLQGQQLIGQRILDDRRFAVDKAAVDGVLDAQQLVRLLVLVFACYKSLYYKL